MGKRKDVDFLGVALWFFLSRKEHTHNTEAE